MGLFKVSKKVDRPRVLLTLWADNEWDAREMVAAAVGGKPADYFAEVEEDCEEETRTPAEIHAEARAHFAETIAMLFVHFGCENYIAFDVQIPTLGLTTVSVQRASGLTPVQKLQKAQDELAEVRAAAKERAQSAEQEMRRWAAIAVAVEKIAHREEGTAEEKLAQIREALVPRG